MSRRRQITTIATMAALLAGSAFAGISGSQNSASNDETATRERGQKLNLLREDLMEDAEESVVAIKPTLDREHVLKFVLERDID